MKQNKKNFEFSHPLYTDIPDSADNITAIYLRVSTDTQAREGYGLDVQYSQIKKYCDAFDIENPVVYIDDGYTGINDRRPAYQKMIADIRGMRIRFVITYSLDRIGRTQMLILKFLKEELSRYGVDFYAVKDNVDSRSKQTYGILISILSIFAEFDHDAIVAKLTEGRRQRAREGYWQGGGVPPYGYVYSKEINTLAVVPEQAIVVEKVFSLYTGGEYSPRLIAEILDLSSDVQVTNILKNRTYLGEITFRGERFTGRHQRIIDDETFLKAQQIMKERSTVHRTSDYLLSSVAVCGVCGGKMRYMMWGRGEKAELKILCYNKYSKDEKERERCKRQIYSAAEAEEAVLGVVMKFALNYSDEIKGKEIDKAKVIDGIKERIEKLRGQYERAVKAYTTLGDEDLLKNAKKIKNDIMRLEGEMEAEIKKRNNSHGVEGRIEELKKLPNLWKRLTNRQKQSAIRSLVSKVVLTGEDMSVYLKSESYTEDKED